jgi:ribonuclease Z
MISVGLFSCSTKRVDKLMKNQVIDILEDRAKSADILEDSDMHVILVGSGGPMNNEDRLPASTAIIAGGEFILVDVGPGTSRNADLQNLPLKGLSGIFLTHFHSDHIGDLGEANFMSWAQGRTKDLDVYGPEGVDGIIEGLADVYELDKKYRIAHHGEDIFPPGSSSMIGHTIEFTDPEEKVLFFDWNGLKAYAFLVDHYPVVPAVGYRFEYKGNVVVITGDTKKTETLAKHARGADILISEGLSMRLIGLLSEALAETSQPRLSKIMKDVLDYHIDPVEAAEVAQEAGAELLVFNHIIPPLPNWLIASIFLKGVEDVYDGKVILGEDGMRFTLAPKH